NLAIFTISGGMAGLAGATYASIVGFVNPGLLGLLMSTQVIVWVALGGRGTLLGGVAGALVVAFLSDYLSGTFVQVWQLILGACLLLVVLFRPEGLLGSERVRMLMGTQSMPARAPAGESTLGEINDREILAGWE